MSDDHGTELNVLLLSKYSRLGASTRLRSLQYLPFLERQGIRVTVEPLFTDAYLQALYSGQGKSVRRVAERYVARLRALRKTTSFDVVWIEYEALPYLPYAIERLLIADNVSVVVDYDDAVFHNYDRSPRKTIRLSLANKIDRVMSHADLVICGNAYLARRAFKAGAREIEHIPTVVDRHRYSAAADQGARNPSSPLTVGWIGSPSTQRYVFDLAPAIEHVSRTHAVRLLLIGAEPSAATRFPGVSVEIQPWSEEHEAELLASIDIGIMPLEDGPWERGKCGYKLIQYMACGKPVIASPVGVNEQIVSDWNCGQLARGQEEWQAALATLIDAPEARLAYGENGREAVRRFFCLDVQAPRLADMLRRVAKSD